MSFSLILGISPACILVILAIGHSGGRTKTFCVALNFCCVIFSAKTRFVNFKTISTLRNTCTACCIVSFGCFPGVWILCADVSEHCHSIFICGISSLRPKERIQLPARGESLKSRMCRVQLKRNGTRWHTGGEVKGKLANVVSNQYSSHYLGRWYIQHYYRWCAHLACQ
jgi:hypothetical protein